LIFTEDKCANFGSLIKKLDALKDDSGSRHVREPLLVIGVSPSFSASDSGEPNEYSYLKYQVNGKKIEIVDLLSDIANCHKVVYTLAKE
jgi:hypothetical protein